MELNLNLLNSLRPAHPSKESRFLEAACGTDPVYYRLNDCIWAGHTGVCEAIIAESPIHGTVLFLDKEIQSASADEAIYHEHLVHPVLNALSHRPHKRVLIVGGAEGATAREVLKWSSNQVAAVDWVDIDAALVSLCRRYLSWADDSVYNDPRLTLHSCDIRLFWDSNTVPYDIIILDLPDPDLDVVTESGNEYSLYGEVFWSILSEQLASGGAVATHCGPVLPGGDSEKRRKGLAWITKCATMAGIDKGHAYHTLIPSFHNEWGFWMSVAPLPMKTSEHKPTNLRVLENNIAFYWAPHWVSPYTGLLE